MAAETPTQERLSNEPTFEISEATLGEILQPDEVLAAQVLDEAIQEAEADPKTDPEALSLLHFQRSLIDMEPRDAHFAALTFVQKTGKYATFSNEKGRLPSLHYPVNRSFIVPDLADQQRWRIVGIDPSHYGDDAYAHAYRKGIEESWRVARKARQDLATAQAAESQAMDRATRPPVFVTRTEK